MPKYEWDENKNKSNQQKHSLSFEKVKEAFQDENAVEFRGNSSTELRILRIGKTTGKILIAVVYTLRSVSFSEVSKQTRNIALS